jgi:hypothetical protein
MAPFRPLPSLRSLTARAMRRPLLTAAFFGASFARRGFLRPPLDALPFLAAPFLATSLGTVLSAAGPFTALRGTSARIAPTRAAFTAAATTAATSRAASAAAPLIAVLAPFVRRGMLFAPLPVLERIPVAVAFVGCGRFTGRFWGFAGGRVLARPLFAMRVLGCALFPRALGRAALLAFATGFAPRGFPALAERLGRSFGFGLRLAPAAERCLEIEVGPEVIRAGWRRGRRALGTRRTGRATLRSPRFAPSRSFGFFAPRLFAFRVGRSGFAGRLRLRGGGRGRLVEQQIFGRNLGVGRRFGAEIDAEQVFGQGFPGIFFAARAGAQRIGVHRALIMVIKRTRSQSHGKKHQHGRDWKALAGK